MCVDNDPRPSKPFKKQNKHNHTPVHGQTVGVKGTQVTVGAHHSVSHNISQYVANLSGYSKVTLEQTFQNTKEAV